MIFSDREEAGEKLAKELKKFKKEAGVVVLALPRGGVVLGEKVAEILGLPLDLVITRKISAPSNSEYAIGAINEEGDGIFNQDEIKKLNIDPKYIKSEVEKEKKEARRRLDLYRSGKDEVELEDKIAIIVDDGIATGLTMMVAIKSVKNKNPKKIIVAIPVSARDSLEKIKNMVDETICLQVPPFFGAVGAFYSRFDQVDDNDVVAIMNTFKN